jgi:hypothetical protein
VLALDGADLGTLGAVAADLDRELAINDLQVGVLASVVSPTAAVATLPVGWLTDRAARVQGTYGSSPRGGAQGLQVTFLIMLPALATAGFLLLRARRDYPRDAATALASEPQAQ